MEDHERAHYERLVRLLRRVEPWMQRIRPDAPRPYPQPGGALHGDNERTPNYETGDAVWSSLMHAVDHLDMMRVVLVDAARIHMYAPHSLIRVTLENASAAVWMLAPASRPERLTRRLRLAAADIRQGEQVKVIMGYPGPRTRDERLADLETIAQREGIDPTDALRRVGYEDMVRAAGAETGPVGETFARVVWRACSGIAHGDMWPTMSPVMTRVELPGAPEGRVAMQISANIETLHIMTLLATVITNRGWELLDERSRSPCA